MILPSDTILEVNTIRRVSVPEQIARRGVPRKGLGDLACEPDLGRVLGDLEMDDSSSMEIKDDHGIEQLKRRGRDHEHVDRPMAVIWFRRKLRQVGGER